MIIFTCSIHLVGWFVCFHTHTHTIKESTETNGSCECCDIINNVDGKWILVAAIRIKISEPVLCFGARQPRLWSQCDTHAHLHYKNVLENERMKFSSATPVAQILQNYFIRLLSQNFLLSEVLITRMCLFMYRSMQQAMPTRAANKKNI